MEGLTEFVSKSFEECTDNIKKETLSIPVVCDDKNNLDSENIKITSSGSEDEKSCDESDDDLSIGGREKGVLTVKTGKGNTDYLYSVIVIRVRSWNIYIFLLILYCCSILHALN